MRSDLHAIARALGGRVNGPDSVRCPGPGHSPVDDSLVVWFGSSETDFRIFTHSTDHWRDCKDYVRSRLGLPEWGSTGRHEGRYRPTSVALASPADTTARALRNFADAVPLPGTSGEKYLIRRIGGSIIWPDDLRFCGSCAREYDGNWERHPAVLALLRDIITNEPCGIQRIYLLPDGSDRLRDKKGKATLGRAKGAVVKLGPNEDVTLGLGLAEGIETGLTMMKAGWCPIWVTVGTSGMESFPVLPGIETLTLFVDSDANHAGENAAVKTIDRWRKAGRDARGIKPRAVGHDWNDAVRGSS